MRVSGPTPICGTISGIRGCTPPRSLSLAKQLRQLPGLAAWRLLLLTVKVKLKLQLTFVMGCMVFSFVVY